MKKRGFPKTKKIVVEEGKFPVRLPSREQSIISITLEKDLMPGKLLNRDLSVKCSTLEREFSTGKFSSREPSLRGSTMDSERTETSSIEASIRSSTIERELTVEPKYSSESSYNPSVDDASTVVSNDTKEILTPLDSSAKYRKYTNMVLKAAKEGKIFQVMYFFDVGKIKEELRKRGYVESPSHLFHSEEQQLPIEQLIELAEEGNEYENALMARLIGNYPPNYLWVPMPCYYHTFMNTPWLNKIYIKECDFGLKDGLCDLVAKLNADLLMLDTDVKCPRSFIAYRRQEVEAFRNDFQFTTATNLLMYLYERDVSALFDNEGTIDQNVLDVLFKVILQHIKHCIEKRPDFPFQPSELDWTHIMKAAPAILKNGAKIQCVGDDFDIIQYYGSQIKFVAGEIMRVWPSRQFDGTQNVWLLKPAYSGQGYDIVLSDNEDTIMGCLNNIKRRYIIQKYIERPLLIHGHKFDIRQYFLVIIEDNELTVFSHPMASFKFASQPFSLDSFHEAIHITNSSIQQKYIASRYDDSPLPRDHLWSVYDFQDYLKTIDRNGAWENMIYPQMKRAINALIIGSLPYIDLKPGRFELFGADWIITENFSTYLLEANYAPGMGYITPVSKLVCGTLMEDVVKVTVDWVIDRTADTGGFEVTYRTPIYKTENHRYCNVKDEEKKLSGKHNSATAKWIHYIQNPTPIP